MEYDCHHLAFPYFHNIGGWHLSGIHFGFLIFAKPGSEDQLSTLVHSIVSSFAIEYFQICTESFFVCCWILKAETSFTCELDFIEQVASGIKYLIRSPTFGFFVQISVEYKYHILWRSLQLIGG